MPIQAPQWTEFLSCPVCRHSFTRNVRPPISLGCGHTICQQCLSTLQRSQCPFDQTPFRTEPQNLPINYALLQLVLPTNGNSLTIAPAGGNSSSSNSSSAYDGQVPPPPSPLTNNNNSSVASPSSATTTTHGGDGGSGGASNHSGSSLETNNNNSNHNGSFKRGEDPASAEIVPLSVRMLASDEFEYYSTAKECIEALALYLKPSPTNNASALTRQMQRKVVALICCQLFEEEGRSRAVRAARLLGERAVTELILHHQNPQQLSANLWAAVRARGCQFLGPAMQEEVLKLVLLALEDGSALSRKVLVMFVVQRLEPVYSQASKTSIGHVVQLLYRASCFKVSKREGDSSLMQLKEEFRTYEALRREHDTQIVQIATEAGLRIAPDQWSSLLYGDTTHKSHMQSINDKLQTPESFSQSVQELVLALQRTSDPAHLSNLQPCLKYLADIDPNAEQSVPTWQQVAQACSAVKKVVTGLADFVQHHGNRKLQEITNANPAPKYKVNMCWIYTQRGSCPRGSKCNFAHSEAELNQSKARHNNRQSMPPGVSGGGNQASVAGVGVGPSKDDFFMLDQYGAKKPPMGHMQSVETSPMRFPGAGTGGSGGGGPVMNKGSPLPQSNNLMLPQPYNGDMMMQMGSGGGVPPPPPPSMNHHGPHHHPVLHHQGHSPLHAPAGPYSGLPQPPTSLHPYHNVGVGGGGGGNGTGLPFNSMMPPTPNQLSPMDKFGFDPTKYNPNIRVSPNLGGSQSGPPMPPPPPPPVMSLPGRSPRNYPNPGMPPIGKVGGGGGFNQNHMFMNDLMPPPPQGNPMLVGPGGGQMPNNNNNNSIKHGGPPNQNINEYGGNNNGDYLTVQQQAKNSSYYWRKQQANQQMPSPNSPQQQQQQNMKSPSHLGSVGGGGGGVVPIAKGHLHGGSIGGVGNSATKSVGGYSGTMQNASINDIMSPRQPLKNSPTFFGKDDLPYWSMGPGAQGQQTPQHPNGDSMHPRDVQRNAVMTGNNGGGSGQHMSQLYGESAGPVGPPSSSSSSNNNSSRRMFDRSDSILAGEDAPFEGNSTTSKYGPIQRKASNSLGTGDTLKSSLGGLGDLRHQAWLNSSQAGCSQTSPRIGQIPIGSEKKLSPSKELGESQSGHQHLLSSDVVTAAADNHGLVGSSALWSPLAPSNGAGPRFMWSDKSYSATPIGSSAGTCRSNSSVANTLLNLDMEDDEKDIEDGLLEISKKLANELE